MEIIYNDIEEIRKKLPTASSIVKLLCGVANNTAWQIMLAGYDHARRCHRYGFKVKQAFKQAINEWNSYERNLIYAKENRMFHTADMPDHVSQLYVNMTDKEYYEFWASIGSSAFQKTQPLITSLWNKHRLSLINHGIDEADHIAWILTAHASLELAEQLYNKAIDDCVSEVGIPRAITVEVFSQFSLSRVKAAWCKAMLTLEPKLNYQLESLELRNIKLGLIQLCDALLDPDVLYSSTIKSVEDYDDLFRTQGKQKKAIKELKRARELALSD